MEPNIRGDIRRIWVFIVTFISYCLYHASRKTLSSVKSTITQEWLHSGENFSNESHAHNFFDNAKDAETFLGTLDAVFMGVYAATMFYWGWLGDRLDPRTVVAVGMFGSGITLCLFGAVPHWGHFYSVPYYVAAYVLFAVFQACGWPNEVAIMSNWFGKGNRGFILGLWACCQPIGNIVGSMLSAAVLPSGYQNAFLLQSVLIVIGGFVIFFGISSHPHMGDLPAYTEIVDDSRVTAVNSSTRVVRSDEEDAELLEKRPPPIGFVSAILLPSVLAYCLCNACLKLVNYAFFFWLPLYLNGKYHLPEKDAVQLSIWYDAGGAVSSVLGGYISDRIGCRSPVIVILLTASLGALFGYSLAHFSVGPTTTSAEPKISEMPPGQAWNAVVMSLVGLCISGPYNLIVGTISADLGSQPALMGNAQALSTVSGLVDGTGSAGSAIGQLIVPLINNNYGWDYVFYMFIVMNFLAVVCLLNRFVLDMRQLFDNYRRRRHEDTEPLLNDQGHNDYSAISPD